MLYCVSVVGIGIAYGCIPALLRYSFAPLTALLLEDGDLACKN